VEIQVENAAAAIGGLRREIEAKDADYANGQNEEWAQAKAQLKQLEQAGTKP
jgi:hypothetical protein